MSPFHKTVLHLGAGEAPQLASGGLPSEKAAQRLAYVYQHPLISINCSAVTTTVQRMLFPGFDPDYYDLLAM